MIQKKLILLLISVACVVNLFAEQTNGYETDEAIRKWRSNYFGVKPHKPNYVLPFGISDEQYKSYVLSDNYTDTEAQLQVSLKLQIVEDLLGWDEEYYLAYTHTAFWQVYTESSPFRETNYNPEGFVSIPMNKDSFPFLHTWRIGIAHISNGQGDNRNVVYPPGYQNPGHRSRSINYFYTSLLFETGNLFSELTLWLPNRHNGDLMDNTDIMDYYGYSSLQLSYFYKKHMFTWMGRVNPDTGHGAMEATYSYPFDIYDDVYFYVKAFSGYGESLIDYNNNLSKFSIGFSFSR